MERPGPSQRSEDEDAPKSIYPWLAGLLALVVLVAVGFVAFQILSSGGNQPPAQVRVPNLIGRTFAQAQADAALNGLTVRQGDSSPDPQNVNRVVRQSPDPDTSVNRNTEIVVTIGTVPSQVVVPDITHHTPTEAMTILGSFGLSLGNQTGARYDPVIQAGEIVESFPNAGLSVDPGRTVDYTLSLGPEPTPSPTPTPAPTPTPPPPTPTATPTFTVQSYRCETLGRTKELIPLQGFTVGNVTSTVPDQTPDDSWIVVDQSPQQGEVKPLDTPIDLLVAPDRGQAGCGG